MQPPDRSEALSLLGISAAEARDPDALRRAYRRCIREVHPDVNRSGDAAERTLALTDAYRSLLEAPQRRPEPDTETPREPPGPGPGGRRRRRPYEDADGALLTVRMLDESSFLVGEDRETTFAALIEAAHSLGEIGYLDRSAWLLEVIVEFVEAPTSSIVMTVQGRATGTEVFCTVEPLSGGDSPPLGPVTDLVARTLRELRAGPSGDFTSG